MSLLKKTVKTEAGIGKIDDIYITELGYVMIKVKFKSGDSGVRFVNYNLGTLQKLFDTDQIQFL